MKSYVAILFLYLTLISCHAKDNCTWPQTRCGSCCCQSNFGTCCMGDTKRCCPFGTMCDVSGEQCNKLFGGAFRSLKVDC
ncbi:hypothetical protein L596_012064 [Steinernema carpocapsae]|uniref:Granulins domain-containing protein n=1 Tax=Steinernema carpocapsae TaxID=34508 RepID=A0A4U5NVW0_STECR|nr:hypothetical protein L596_012064 [Steinernema carpocapsae]